MRSRINTAEDRDFWRAFETPESISRVALREL